MWQRKQTVYLVIAAGIAFMTWLFPIATYTVAEGQWKLMTDGLLDPSGEVDPFRRLKMPFQWMYTVLGAALLVSVLFYGNRPRQWRFVRGTYLLALALVAFQYITSNSVLAELASGQRVERVFGPVFYAPMVVLLLAFLAERAVRSDEALVRSADRLR
jgi:hypothetical protein